MKGSKFKLDDGVKNNKIALSYLKYTTIVGDVIEETDNFIVLELVSKGTGKPYKKIINKAEVLGIKTYYNED